MENNYTRMVIDLVNKFGIDEVAILIEVSSRSVRNYMAGENPTAKAQRKLVETFKLYGPNGNAKTLPPSTTGTKEDFQARYIALLEKREDDADLRKELSKFLEKRSNEPSLDELWEAVAMNRRMLASLYQILVVDKKAKADKIVVEVIQKVLHKDSDFPLGKSSKS